MSRIGILGNSNSSVGFGQVYDYRVLGLLTGMKLFIVAGCRVKDSRFGVERAFPKATRNEMLNN